MILSTDRNGKLAVTLASGELVGSVVFTATRPLWQVKWWRRVAVALTIALGVGLAAFAYWQEESRSGLLIRLTEENSYQRRLLQCYKQAPLIQVSWLARESWAKQCVDRANP